jgi:hypothetical protein
MSTTLLIPAADVEPSDGVGAGPARPGQSSAADGPARTLADDLRALIRGEVETCLVCGEQVERSEAGRLECPVCGSALEPLPAQIEGQLALM